VPALLGVRKSFVKSNLDTVICIFIIAKNRLLTLFVFLEDLETVTVSRDD